MRIVGGCGGRSGLEEVIIGTVLSPSMMPYADFINLDAPALTLVSKRLDFISVKRARAQRSARFDLKARVGVPLRA
jgi:hypothetical protein